MEPVLLKKDVEKELRMYREFFVYGIGRALKKFPIVWITAAAAVIALAGLLLDRRIIAAVGAAMFVTMLVYLLFWLIGTCISILSKMSRLKKALKTTPEEYRFWFDENGLHFGIPDSVFTTPWSEISGADYNEKRIYIFREKAALQGIYKPELMGEENFNRLISVLVEKLGTAKGNRSSASELTDDLDG
jgi:hypothetical protein